MTLDEWRNDFTAAAANWRGEGKAQAEMLLMEKRAQLIDDDDEQMLLF